MDDLRGLNRLSSNLRMTVSSFLEHRALKRLGFVRQLGFWPYDERPRLTHTLESIDCAAFVLGNLSGLNEEVRHTFLAAIALEDIGRAPFSNSLDSVFTALPGLIDRRPLDVERSVLVIRYLEESERLLSHRHLDVDAVVAMVRGNVPWEKAQRLRSLISGPLDIDRLVYTKGDVEAARGISFNINDAISGLQLDTGDGATVIDSSASTAIVNLVINRCRMYMQVYYNPEKIALEAVVRDFFVQLWSGENSSLPVELKEPRTVTEFLQWDDRTVVALFARPFIEELPERLERLRKIIAGGDLQFGEVRERGETSVDIDEIERKLSQAKAALAAREFCWFLDGDQIPQIQPFEPGSIVVRSRDRYRDFAQSSEMRVNPELTDTLRRCPLLVFSRHDLAHVQETLRTAGLAMFRSDALVGIHRLIT